jgi:hypothetical protein
MEKLMLRHRSLFASILCLVLVTALFAEKVDMSPAQLRKTATHVILGNIVAVYERTETSGDWKYTMCLAEIRVQECEKGDGINKGDLVYARYWQRAWTGKSEVPPTTTGHRDLPSNGQSLRVYMARNAYDGFSFENKDGGFNVIGANGFEKVKPDSTK